MKKYRRWISLFCILLCVFPLRVMATEEERNLLEPSRTVSVTNNPNEVVIYNFLKTELGLNTAASCAILANLYVTSYFNPEAHNTNDTGGSQSFGLCQWNSGVSAGNRYQQLCDWCLEHGYDYKTVEGQLNFIKHELETVPYYKFNYLKNQIQDTAEGAYEASQIWSKYYEGCNKVYYEQRAVLARDTYWETYQMHAGEVEPTPPESILLGDVNGDGEVKLNDALLLRRYVAGYEIQIDLKASDVNGDGEVKLNDALLLRRHVAGYDFAADSE